LKNDVSEPARRSFLQTARSVGILGAALSVLGRGAVVEAKTIAPQPDDPVSAVSGYHETEHIRKYYAAARYF
jgi:hypothetical protein